jgi:DNA-binding transcriptional MerR regulator
MSATYNVGAVVQETGLKPDTLRVWERRYGLPMPERSTGGHRLYSARDIATLKWLLARRKEGMSISRAAALWHSLEAEGQDPLRMTAPTFPGDSPPTGAEAAPLADLRQEWVAACLAFDEERAEAILTQAFGLFPPDLVAVELLQNGIAQIGKGWYRGEVTVQQEHFASEQAMRRLNALVMANPPPTRVGRVLVACPPEEEHDFAPLLLTFLLRRRGWPVLFLGARVPLTKLKETLVATHPHLVVLAAQQLTTAATLLEVAEMLQYEKFPLAFGGRIFNLLPELRERIPGRFLGETVVDSVETVEQLLSAPDLISTTTKTTAWAEGDRDALDNYRERQFAIEAALWSDLDESGIPYASLAMANAKLAENIIAALRLGDINYLGNEIDWIKGLLDNHAIPAEHLGRFAKAYHQAASAHLDERGRPILDWFKERIWENSL